MLSLGPGNAHATLWQGQTSFLISIGMFPPSIYHWFTMDTSTHHIPLCICHVLDSTPESIQNDRTHLSYDLC